MYQSIKELIKRYPIEAFFVSAIAICYVTLFPAIYLLPRNAGLGGIMGFFLGKIGVYSPVIAGMFITQIILPGKHQISFISRLKISLPVWFLAVVVNTASLKLTAPPNVPMIGLIILSIPVALLPAWVVSSAFSGSDSIRNMLKTLIKPRGEIFYYLFALLTFPVVMVVGTIITNIIAGNPWLPKINQGSNLLLVVLINFFFVIFFAGGINEEAGWRGFAQKRMQAKYSPLFTAILLWFYMVIWHIPNDLIQYQYGGYIMVRIVLYLFITILFTWTYNRTKGSILAIVIFHASMNSMNPLMGIFPITTASNVLLIALAITVLILGRMWRKLPIDHPAVFQEVVPVTQI